MTLPNHGARRMILRGNFEFFAREPQPEGQAPKRRFKADDDLPPPHAFFTSFASRPVLMTFGLRLEIPLIKRNPGRRSSLRSRSRTSQYSFIKPLMF